MLKFLLSTFKISLPLLLIFTIHNYAEAQTTTVAEFSVKSGQFERNNTPVAANLDGIPLQLEKGELQLYEVTNGEKKPVASQLKAGSPDQLLWILEEKTEPGTVRNYKLEIVEEPEKVEQSDVFVEDDGEALNLTLDDKPVLNYRYKSKDVPKGVDEVYSRGGYIHPLWSPEGEVLTRIQPPDHYHHYGIWNPWTRTEFEGREIDFWNLAEEQGTVQSRGLTSRTSGPVNGGFKARHDHIDFTGSEEKRTALNEELAVEAWNVDPDRELWLVDVGSVLNPATDQPLTIKEYRYQGFSLRATEKWNDKNAHLLTSDGKDKSDANGTRARWIDVNGISEAEEGTSGILFMTHPGNFNFPEQLRIWPTGMNEGEENVFINFNPAQDRDWELKPGNTYGLKYRMLVYDGEIDEEKAERYWRDFAHPPKVEVHKTGNLQGAKVLVYTKNGEGYVHDNIPNSIEALEKLGEEYDFEVDASDDPSLFTDENLDQYDALVFSNTNNEIFDTDEQREALQTYIRNGGGFAAIHSASGSERDWPWFSKLIGGNFERHAPLQDFSVDVVDHGHPSTSHLSEKWEVEDDECYYLDELNPQIKVLLSADMSTVEDEEKDQFPGELFGDGFPLAWYQEFDGGRQWYTTLGHRPEHYEDDQFMNHVLGGIQWVVGN